MENEDFGLAKNFLAGAGVDEFLPEGSRCDKKYKGGDRRWRKSSKEEQARVLRLLQVVLSCPLTVYCVKYLHAPDPLGWELTILDEQEQKLYTYLLEGGIKGTYGKNLFIYLMDHIRRRPDREKILLSFLDLSLIHGPLA